MTRGDVIKLARQAGMGGMLTDVVCTIDELERFAGLVAAAEREALAQPTPTLTHKELLIAVNEVANSFGNSGQVFRSALLTKLGIK